MAVDERTCDVPEHSDLKQHQRKTDPAAWDYSDQTSISVTPLRVSPWPM